MAEAHAQGRNVKPKTALAGMAIPLHPGAEKFYREAGMIKAESAKKAASKKR